MTKTTIVNSFRYMMVIIAVGLIGYWYLNRLWINQVDICSSMDVTNTAANTSIATKTRAFAYPTYIISAIPQRVNFTSTVLHSRLPDFFNTYHKQSILPNDSRIFKSIGIHAASLMLTYIDLWREIGSKSEAELAENDWVFIFEDDVDIVPLGILRTFFNKVYMRLNQSNTSPVLAELIKEGLRLATRDGILYLGTCGPTYVDNATTMYLYSNGLIQYRRGFYFCTHAIAYTKWRVKTIWDELGIYKLMHNEAGADTMLRQWQRLSKTYPFSMATNIQWPPNTGHFGFFYQARGVFPSTIQG